VKIVLTGGGSGGHFYPLISVAENLREITKKEKFLSPVIYYLAPEPYDERALFDNEIIFKKNISGKKRIYFSFRNFFDFFKIFLGVLTAFWQIFMIFPDVIFAKGGYASFPVLLAARFFGIPVIIHESDSMPGRVNLWAGKFAQRIGVSFPEAVKFFPEEKTVLTGNPIRKELLTPAGEGAKEFLNLEENLPIIFILGGSQGAEKINNVILEALEVLVQKYQIIHQTGPNNIGYVRGTAKVILGENFTARYKPFAYLDDLAMKMSAGAASLVISRAGSVLFEIANWGLPSILIPIPESISRDQRKNAFSYASRTGAVVIEEENLSPNLLISEIERILSNPALMKEMSRKAGNFSSNDAGRKIAREVLRLGLEHES